MNYFWLGRINPNWGPVPTNTNWGPAPVNTSWGPGPVNTNWGPGPGLGLGAKQRAGGREIQRPNSNTFRYYNYHAKLSCQKVRLTMSMHDVRRSSEWFHLAPAPPPAEFI